MKFSHINSKNVELLSWLCEVENEYKIKIDVKNREHLPDISVPENLSFLEKKIVPVKRKTEEDKEEKTITNHKKGKKSIEDLDTKDLAFPPDLGGRKVNSKGLVQSYTKYPTNLKFMEDSSHLFLENRGSELWNKFSHDGYLLLRGFLNKRSVEEAHSEITNALISLNHVSKDSKHTALSKTGWTVDMESGTIIAGRDDFADDKINKQETRQKWYELGKSKSLQDIVNNSSLASLFKLLSSAKSLEETSAQLKSRTNKTVSTASMQYIPRLFHPNFSWLRIKAHEEFTPAHADIYYFRKFTDMFEIDPPDLNEEDDDTGACDVGETCAFAAVSATPPLVCGCNECGRFYHPECCGLTAPVKGDDWFCAGCRPRPVLGTCWVPLADVSASDGVLAVLESSHRLLSGLDRPPYPDTQLPKSFMKPLPEECVWRVMEYRAGDLVLFDSKAIHCTSKNYGDSFRLSLDFRWYLSPPRDPQQEQEKEQTAHRRFMAKHSTAVP